MIYKGSSSYVNLNENGHIVLFASADIGYKDINFTVTVYDKAMPIGNLLTVNAKRNYFFKIRVA